MTIAFATIASAVLAIVFQLPSPVQPTAGRPTPVFSQWSTFCEGVEHTTSVALGDLDRDGDLDVIFGNGRHVGETDWVFSNNGHGMFYGKRALGTDPDATYAVALGDLDGDSFLDAVVANDLGDPSVVYQNDGKGDWGQDIDKDGRPDRIGLAPLNAPSRVYVNDGRADFRLARSSPLATTTRVPSP